MEPSKTVFEETCWFKHTDNSAFSRVSLHFEKGRLVVYPGGFALKDGQGAVNEYALNDSTKVSHVPATNTVNVRLTDDEGLYVMFNNMNAIKLSVRPGYSIFGWLKARRCAKAMRWARTMASLNTVKSAEESA